MGTIAQEQCIDIHPRPNVHAEDNPVLAPGGTTEDDWQLKIEDLVVLVIFGGQPTKMAAALILIGLAIMGSAVGGFFAREPPGIFQGDFSAYLTCLPGFISLGFAEVLVGICAYRSPSRFKKLSAIALLGSIPVLILTSAFTGFKFLM